jgi:hypothetical protein
MARGSESSAGVGRAAWQRGSVAAWQRGSVAAWQRGSVAAWQRGSVAAWQRGSVAAWQPRRGHGSALRPGVSISSFDVA